MHSCVPFFSFVSHRCSIYIYLVTVYGINGHRSVEGSVVTELTNYLHPYPLLILTRNRCIPGARRPKSHHQRHKTFTSFRSFQPRQWSSANLRGRDLPVYSHERSDLLPSALPEFIRVYPVRWELTSNLGTRSTPPYAVNWADLSLPAKSTGQILHAPMTDPGRSPCPHRVNLFLVIIYYIFGIFLIIFSGISRLYFREFPDYVFGISPIIFSVIRPTFICSPKSQLPKINMIYSQCLSAQLAQRRYETKRKVKREMLEGRSEWDEHQHARES